MATILIASPHETERRRLSEALSQDGHTCLVCADGKEVERALDEALPDLVITDVVLPGMDAFDVVRLLERLSGGNGVPLLVGHSDVAEGGDMSGAEWMGLAGNADDFRAMVRGRLATGPVSEARATLLVIEDDFDLRSLLGRRLKMSGYEVVTAQDGEDGLEHLGPEIDLVLTDVDMPRMDGFGFLSRVRAEARFRDLPVIVMTAQAGRAEDAARGLELGANDYVRKPFDWRELLARVETQLRVRDAYRLAAEKQRDLAIIELAGAAAHEINNPLSVVMARLQLMRERMGTSGEFYEDMVKLSKMVDRIAGIVKKMGQVRRYQVQHYCGGANILDLDGAARDSEK